ncbi:MAG: hypothetical protein HETSPECPRED_005744 [Heterodermia speciosa]|uniref:FAD/NAD(P)-binding domain-containing protein n=1 Tax=Heterodermia speciosa TaxID=116794 RepID=A0A8H3IEH9_9LECA|nr:MAG: hypothetical protein HETSPECPRED_005744 [Heterodermia speciosa]
MAASKKNIVIIGGSYGGISVAHNLLKHAIPILPDQASYQIVLVSAASQVICRPACPRALISDEMFNQNKLFVGIPQVFEQYPKGSLRFVHARATNLDYNDRIVSVTFQEGNTEQIDYHALVIATGASTPSPLHGLNRDEQSLKASWHDFRKALPNAKSIVITGAGPTGVETAGELGEYLNGRPGWFSSKPEKPNVSITVVNAGSQILPVLRPAIAAKAERLLDKVGVTVIKNARVQSVKPEGAGTETALTTKTTVTLNTGQTLDADLYIPATGSKPNTGFVPQALLAPDGRVDTNPATLRVDKAGERVYAIGDASSYARQAIHIMLEAIPVVSANIKRDLLLAAGKEGVGEDRNFQADVRETQMVPVGRSKGVGAAMGYQLPSLLVWLIKGRDYWLWTTGGLWSGKQWVKEK